jgi:hypothetical protein
MGEVPDGFKFPSEVSKFGNPTGLLYEEDPEVLPNGVDFWWDEAPTSNENCWYDNTGQDGTRDSITADPPLNPVAGTSIPGFLPEDCATAVGNGAAYGAKVLVLLSCFAEYEGGDPGSGTCPWFDDQSKPGTRAFRLEQAEERRYMKDLAKTPEAENIEEYFSALSGKIDLGPGD